ncbi:hypothetical protein ACFQZJ_12220 [Maribacter chungangensis]|uniref:Uncharacterized protein n=1 Tax=Maribacter chungangensis TaxID=1069117 RepID=A0ABW3B4H7_9FLAO
MKKIILLFICTLSTMTGISQNSMIPEVVWNGITENENQYVELLNLKDKNSLIVRVAYSGYWNKGLSGQYIIYQNDGKIKRYKVFQPSDSDLKTKVKRKRVRKKDFQNYWNYLKNCISEKKFQINKTQLNIDAKPGKEKGTRLVKSISDGTTYHFSVYQGKNYIAYASFEPKSFIEDEYPGFEERQKLVDLMAGFETLAEKY